MTGLGEKLLKIKETPAYLKCVGYDQQNPHHYLPLDQHMLQAQEYVMMETLPVFNESTKYTEMRANRVIFAALFHDIAKPDCAVMRNGIMTFYGHADASADMFMKEAEKLTCAKDSKHIEIITQMIRQHDDFISYKTSDVPENHPFLRRITPETVAEKILERCVTFDEALDDIQIRHLCRRAVTGNDEPFNTKTAYVIPECELKDYCTKGNPKYSQTSSLFYRDLLLLCKADASAQSEKCVIRGQEYTRAKKIENMNTIESMLPKALAIVDKVLYFEDIDNAEA